MCRLLGIVSSERTSFHFSLQAAPRSLASLSSEHPHGWGIARLLALLVNRPATGVSATRSVGQDTRTY